MCSLVLKKFTKQNYVKLDSVSRYKNTLMSEHFCTMFWSNRSLFWHYVLPFLPVYFKHWSNNIGLELLDFFSANTSLTRGHTCKSFQAMCNKLLKIKLFLQLKPLMHGTIYQNVWLKLIPLIVLKIYLINTSLHKCLLLTDC